LLTAAVLFPQVGKSQDFHLSQFRSAPITLNPANTGCFLGDWRTAFNYRKQWTALGAPFENNSLSFDKPLYLKKSKLGIGAVVMSDNSSQLDFTSRMFSLSLAYQRFIGNHFISIGAQPVYTRQNYARTGLSLPEQYNMYSGYYDPNIPISETSLYNHLSFFDINFGVNWKTFYKNHELSAGLSLSHISFPQISFTDNPYTLPTRILMHAEASLELMPFLTLKPSSILIKQQKADELFLGSFANVKLPWNMLDFEYLSLGIFFRTALFENFDAFVFVTGLHYGHWDLNFSYDINMSGLSEATNNWGAFELSFVYRGFLYSNQNYTPPCVN